MAGRRWHRGEEGQALVEMIVVLPVLLLLLLAAADMGKLFVISGKNEIAARYIALSHFRGAPFGDAYMGQTATQEIEGLFFDDALNDHSDDPDVTYQELGGEDLLYAPGNLGDPWLDMLWDYVNATEELVPIRGTRSTFTYDLPFFPYGREHSMEETRDLEDTLSPSRLAASYDVSGNFVVLADAFSGAQGDLIRVQMEAIWLAIGAEASLPAWAAIVGVMWLIFLP